MRMGVASLLKIAVCLVAAALLIVAIYLLGNTIARRRMERPVVGALSFAAALDASLQLQTGDFLVAWRPEKGGALTIAHRAHPDRLLWETAPARAFAAAALGAERVVERRGMFFFRDRIRRRYPHQHITGIRADDRGVHVEGHLSARPGADDTSYTLSLYAVTNDRLGFSLTVDAEKANRTYLTAASSPEEGFYGFGAQFTHFDLKGKRVPIFVMEQGIGRGRQPLTFLMNLIAGAGGAWHTSYAVAPHYLSSRMRSLFLETYEYAVFDLRCPDTVQISLFAANMRGSILAGDTPEALIAAYTKATGRMRPLPDWILEGAVIGMQGGTEKVRRVWRALQEHETPVAAFWLQDWVGQRATIVGKQLWWNWELDRDHYPDWEELLADFDAAGIRVMTYINPFLIDPAAKNNYTRNLFQEAMEKGYLIKRADKTPYLIKNTDFSAAMLDLSNPEARAWIKDVISEQVIGVGASGWMADFGEALPYDALLHDAAAETYHNRYPEVWAQVNREAIEETGRGDDFVFFMRSGYRESPGAAPLFWLGDQMVTWDRHDGMKSAVTGLLSSGISGYAFNHSDIGGYTAIAVPLFAFRRDRELLKRWMELNAFSVVFRTHEGVAPDANHQFYTDAESLDHFSRCARIYAAWADYRKALVRQAADTGLPVVRHPFIHYPDEPWVRTITSEQFMVGDVFMVAPVLDPGVSHASCFLPAGQWTHLWSGREYAPPDSGQQVRVEAPLGQPAVFYKTTAPEAHEFVEALKKMNVL